jgi:hypothetical protein
MMVKAGYLTPEEAESNIAGMPFKDRMDNAAQIFYELSADYSPDQMSPQHDALYQAAISTYEEPLANKMPESHADLNLGSLSSCLTGLSKIAMSYRHDSERRDHLSDFYEKELKAEEQLLRREDIPVTPFMETVYMERAYLKGWSQVSKSGPQFLETLTQMAKQTSKAEHHLEALLALSSVRLGARELRELCEQSALKGMD